MITAIDDKLLSALMVAPYAAPDPAALYRDGRVFFVGGDLPVVETVQTMHDSYCQESTDLLYLTFGDRQHFSHNLEMSRIVKKNFSVRLLGRIDRILSGQEAEQLYLAGIDLLEMQQVPDESVDRHSVDSFSSSLQRAVTVFPRWSISVSLLLGRASLDELKRSARELLHIGAVPVLKLSGGVPALRAEELRTLFQTLADLWREYAVPVRHYQPILRLTAPFVWRESGGLIRSVVARLHNRQLLAASDLRRHLRTKAAEASFESAGL